MNKAAWIFILLTAVPGAGFAQWTPRTVPADREAPTFQEARFHAEAAAREAAPSFSRMMAEGEAKPAVKRKSPFLAGLLSVIIPGAGEVYTESYATGAGFVALEALGWWGNTAYNNKGDVATNEFQTFADGHWSVVKYAQWLNDNAKNFPGGDQAQPITINADATLPPWQRVSWTQLNSVELLIPQFSHRLPAHGDQQYYELIGKYNQYSYGWDDKLAGSGDGWSDYNVISPHFRFYSLDRGRANTFYNHATVVANLIVLNHVLSAADAAWAAVRWNKAPELHSSIRIVTQPNSVVEFVPTMQLSWRL
jgi:hypothetical protein